MKNLIKKLTASIGILSMAVGFASCCYAVPPVSLLQYKQRWNFYKNRQYAYSNFIDKTSIDYKRKFREENENPVAKACDSNDINKQSKKYLNLIIDFHGLTREKAKICLVDALHLMVQGEEFDQYTAIELIPGKGNHTDDAKYANGEYIKQDIIDIFAQIGITSQFNGGLNSGKFVINALQVRTNLNNHLRKLNINADQALQTIDNLYNFQLRGH